MSISFYPLSLHTSREALGKVARLGGPKVGAVS